MPKSMFEQLKKAGLVDKSKEHKLRADQKQQSKKQRQQKKKDDVNITPEAAAAQKALIEKQQRDRQLNAERKAAADQKAIKAQIKQLIETHRQAKGVNLEIEDQTSDDQVNFNFAEDNKVKQILVSNKVHQQLTRGQLAIVKLDEGYELVPSVVAERILSRDPDYCVICNEKEEIEDEDDPYKDYKIPDDLMW